MCLALPTQIIAVNAGGLLATVEIGGIQKDVHLGLVDDVRVGDYVIVHVGHAIGKLDPEEAEKTLALFAELGQAADAAGSVGAAA